MFIINILLNAYYLVLLQLHISSHEGDDATSPSPSQKEVDFFKEHVDQKPLITDTASALSPQTQPISISNGSLSNKVAEPVDLGQGPNVEPALSMSPTTAIQQAEPRKATIGARKPAGAKKGVSLEQ